MRHDAMCPAFERTFGADDSAPCGLCGVPGALIPKVRAEIRYQVWIELDDLLADGRISVDDCRRINDAIGGLS